MLAVAFSSLLVQLGGEAFVDPKDYVSPSGAYVLHVEPSARDGAGPGEYRMIRAGELVWSSRLPFTLHEAALTDSGATVGYAYDGGAEETEGNFREVLLAPDGRVLLDARTERRLSRWGCWPPPEPRALGLVVDEPNDRFVVRIADDDPARGKELWRAYQLSTGEKLAELRPQEGLPRNEYDYVEISAVRPVRDTGLFLLHEFHWRCDSGPSGSECPTGGFFALIELGGRVVWQLQLPHDYEIEGTDSERWIFAWSVCEKGAILDFPAPRTFDLRFVQEGQRVRFMASPAPDSESGWTVAELGRRPWEAPDGKVAKASGRSTGAVGREAHERIELRELATVALERSARPAPAIRDVEAWSFTEDGGFQFVRRDERVYSIVEVDR